MLNFGITFKGDMAPGRTIELAKRAEAGGFTYIWIFDSHVLWRESSVMLGYLAANTSIVKLGPCVTNPGVRDWTVVASTFAGLNVVSGGRAAIGIGRGDSSRRVLGKKPMTIQTMKEFSLFIRKMAEGEKITYEGKEQWLGWANPDYKLPIWIAGYGPKVLKDAGTYAGGIILQIADVDLIPWFIERAHEGAKEAGRDPNSIKVLSAAPVFIHSDKSVARKHVKWFPAMVGNHVADIVMKYGETGGNVPEAFTKAISGRKGYDYRQHADKDSNHLNWITDEVVDRFCIVGSVEDHINKLKALKKAGVDQFNLYLMSDDEERILDIYIKEIIPEVNKW